MVEILIILPDMSLGVRVHRATEEFSCSGSLSLSSHEMGWAMWSEYFLTR